MYMMQYRFECGQSFECLDLVNLSFEFGHFFCEVPFISSFI